MGTTPPEWSATHWLNSPPLTLASLRGHVVVVRWWTAGCPFCSTSAPALRELARELGPRGVFVVGMYHHRDEGGAYVEGDAAYAALHDAITRVAPSAP